MYLEKFSYEYGIYWFEKASREGHLYSQNNLAICHFKRQDYFRCEKWLTIASEENLEESFFNLAILYENLDKIDEATDFYEKGAKLDEINCKYNLAIINYENKNLKEAIELYKSLYKVGYENACFNLGLIMELKKEYDECKKYYLKSAEKNHTNSQYRLAYIYELTGDIQNAIKYYEKAINNNHNLSKFRLANLYNKENKIDKAKRYYLMSIDIKESINNLASIYFEEENYEEAIKYYEEASEYINVSFENLGDLYYNLGQKERAIFYYLKNKNSVSAQIKLGNIYEDEKDYEKAVDWYQKACNNGDYHSSYKIGCIFYNLGKNYTANEYFRLASENNHINSQIYLGKYYFDEKRVFLC